MRILRVSKVLIFSALVGFAFCVTLNNEVSGTDVGINTDTSLSQKLRFVSNSQSEFQLLSDRLTALQGSVNEALGGSSIENSHSNLTALFSGYHVELGKCYFDIFISLSVSKEQSEILLNQCQTLSKSLASHYERLVPTIYEPLVEQRKPDFQSIRVELENEKDSVLETLFDVKRYVGSAEFTGKKINKRLVEIQTHINTVQYMNDADFRMVVTLHKFLKDVARIFLDYNNLFRYPEGVMLSIEEQFNRKLKSIKNTFSNSQIHNSDSKVVSDALKDASIVFKLLPLFRDPIGGVSSENDSLLQEIRSELIRLRRSTEEVELCFIKRMRVRFEKVWYSIDWVHQYANFIFVKSGGAAPLPLASDFSIAVYLFSFAEWADLISSWNMDSLENRLIGFTIRAISNELDSAEIFKEVGRSKYASVNEQGN